MRKHSTVYITFSRDSCQLLMRFLSRYRATALAIPQYLTKKNGRVCCACVVGRVSLVDLGAFMCEPVCVRACACVWDLSTCNLVCIVRCVAVVEDAAT